jgi:hypothetical protein
MGTKALRGRESWQDVSGPKAEAAENEFYDVFLQEFKGTEFRIRDKPKEFRSIYNDIKLSDDVLDEIFSPEDGYGPHGIKPDYAIDNIKTKKTLYVEVKRQDGWVEGKKPSAGRGNAHERSCKFFTPGLLKILRSKGNLGDDVLPFWVVFQGDIARDPKRVREITTWYGDYTGHYFFWRDVTNKDPLINHFTNNLRHLLSRQ